MNVLILACVHVAVTREDPRTHSHSAPLPPPPGVFLVWAYVPEATLHGLGITYYPDKYWALALPAFFCTAYALSGVAYVGLNMLSTAPLDSLQTLTGEGTRSSE